MEISEVRKQVLGALERSRRQAVERRTRVDAASRAYETFLQRIAVPLFKQVAGVLKAEGLAFTVFTPGGSVRLMSDRHADDYVELTLEADAREPFVQVHSSRRWGKGIVEAEEAIGDPERLSEEDVLSVVLKALEPLVER